MTAATFGIVAAVIIGLIIIKWGTKKGHTSFLANYDDLPHELQTGLLPGDKRESMGESSCSSISIDPLTFNLIIVAVIALGGYCISKTVSHFMRGFELPVFSCAFVVGIFIKKIFDKTRTSDYVCPQTIGHISGAFTDFLVAFGIASIKISVVIEYIIPLLILLVSGLIATLISGHGPQTNERMLVRESYLHMGMVYRNYGYGHRIAPRCRPQNAQPMPG